MGLICIWKKALIYFLKLLSFDCFSVAPLKNFCFYMLGLKLSEGTFSSKPSLLFPFTCLIVQDIKIWLDWSKLARCNKDSCSYDFILRLQWSRWRSFSLKKRKSSWIFSFLPLAEAFIYTFITPRNSQSFYTSLYVFNRRNKNIFSKRSALWLPLRI